MTWYEDVNMWKWKIAYVIDISEENISDFSSTDRYYEIINTNASDSESGRKGSDQERWQSVTGFSLLIWTLDQAQLFQCGILNMK
jgi:hypothetical protein